jgi:hypothetical protein
MKQRIVLLLLGMIILLNVVFFVNAYFIYLNLGSPFSETVIVPRGGKERFSPFNWVDEQDIVSGEEELKVLLQQPVVTKFADTNSMDPVLDSRTNGIEIMPTDPEQIHKGDIIAYFSRYNNQFIVHRVVDIGVDDDGWYAVAKGDNQLYADPGKIRWDQVEGVTVGLLY